MDRSDSLIVPFLPFFSVPPNKAQDMVSRETPLTSEAVIGVLRQAGLGVEHAYLDPSPYNEAGAAYFYCGPPNGTPEQQQKVLVMVSRT